MPIQSPSPEWTPQERLDVIGSQAFSVNYHSIQSMIDIIQAIQMLTIQPAEFLEANRDIILEGIEIEEQP